MAELFGLIRDSYSLQEARAWKAIRMAVLFTQQLSPAALATLENWFGADNIEALVL